MSAENLILIGVALVAIAAAAAAFAIAYRRSSDWRSGVNAETLAADRSEVAEPVAVAAAQGTEAAAAADAAEAPPEPATPAVEVVSEPVVVEVSPEEAGVTRRQFFNRALGATFATFMAGFGLASLSFLWPKLTGGFGSDVNAGNVDELREQLFNEDGSVTPLFIPEARAYLVPYEEGSLSPQFRDIGVADRGVMALWQRCVHLGCRVPWCQPSQGFECPCHGSKYSLVGEYFAGPAPRNLDRFVLEFNAADELIIKTGSIVQTPRAPVLTVKYPQGPSCIAATVGAEG